MDRAELIHGTLFDIQGFSVHDGPGCRTLIFFKGCSLHCRWCSNPEGISPHPEPLYRADKCCYDRACATVCPHHAITFSGLSGGGTDPARDEPFTAPAGRDLPPSMAYTLHFDRTKCRQCHDMPCVEACLTGALRAGGFETSLESLFARILRDRQYWGPGGGITLTGGEPFMQPAFARALLEKCYKAYIHTAAETCGNVPWENIEVSLPWLEWIFFDIKHMDPEKHGSMTIAPTRLLSDGSAGSIHERILTNAAKLAREYEGRLIFRMPVIPGFNDDPDNIEATARFLIETGRKEINILPAHHLGREKYSMLGQDYFYTALQVPSPVVMDRIGEQFTAAGIHCYQGSDTPF